MAQGTFEIKGCGRVHKWVDFEGEIIELTLDNVLHAPELQHNLILIGSLVKKGVKLGIDKRGVTLHAPDGHPFMHCPMSGTMFVVEFVSPLPIACMVKSLHCPADLKM